MSNTTTRAQQAAAKAAGAAREAEVLAQAAEEQAEHAKAPHDTLYNGEGEAKRAAERAKALSAAAREAAHKASYWNDRAQEAALESANERRPQNPKKANEHHGEAIAEAIYCERATNTSEQAGDEADAHASSAEQLTAGL